MESSIKTEVPESSSISNTNDNNGDKAVIVRVKRKPDQSLLQAFWLEINERPAKRPLIDFQKLSISASTTSTSQEEAKIKRVLVEHVETVGSSKASIQFLQSFVQPNLDGHSKFKASTKERRRNLQKENKHDQILSKAKQEQEEIAKGARFEQIWKRRTRDKEVSHDEALDDVCRVYDVLRVDESSKMVEKKEEISVEDQEMLSKFLPLLREYVPDAVEDIEADMCSHASRQGSADDYVYDLYAVNEKIDETEASYPFPLVQVDDDDQYYDGPDDSDYETDDSNAENHPYNDYPEEESSEEEEKSSKSGSASEEEGSEAESDMLTKSDDSEKHERSEDPLYEDETDEVPDGAYSDDEGDDDEDWKWAHR